MGDLVSVKCAISQDDFEGGKPFNETVIHAICAVVKLLGKNCLEVNTNAVTDRNGDFVYDMITMKYKTALATIEIGTGALRIISGGFIVSAVSVTSSGALEGL